MSYLADRVAVMYLGKIVETIEAGELVEGPRHPYTRALLAAVPDASPGRGLPEVPLTGEPPDPRHPPAGCRFHHRCPLAVELCRREEPVLVTVTGCHTVACHLSG